MTKKLPESRGPWTCLTREVVYENPWIHVQHETVTTPAGTAGIYGVVHFKGRAVGVVPVDAEHYTYLVGQTRYTLNAYSWEIPEGGAHTDETLEACALRELEEEVGLCASELTSLGSLHLSNSVTDESAHYFLAMGLTRGLQKLDATEDIQVKRVPLSEAVNMVLRGEITDAISVAALLRLALEKPELLVTPNIN
jgi:8-oxo-dGTP pyrophosphatase MutT (NUDIX family)